MSVPGFREKQLANIPEVREHEICISKSRVLVQRILCRYGRKNEKKIAEYMRGQLQEDMMEAQISLKEFVDPFTGVKYN